MAVISNNGDHSITREHHMKLSLEGIPGTKNSRQDIADTLTEDFSRVKGVWERAQSHNRINAQTGFKKPPATASFIELLGERYGMYSPKEERGTIRGEMKVLLMYMNSIGVDVDEMTFGSVARKFGIQHNLDNREGIESFLTTDVANGTTFVIRQVFLEMIRLGTLYDARLNNWISKRQPIGDLKVTIPRMLDTDATPERLEEEESYRRGRITFAEKEVEVAQYGIAMEISDRVAARSTVSMMAEFLPSVGRKMGRGDERLFLDVLQNGDQDDLSESAAKIGSQSGSGFTWHDLVRIIVSGNELEYTFDHVISNREDLITMSLINEIKGFDGNTSLASIKGMVGRLPKEFNSYSHSAVPTSEIYFFDPSMAVMSLEFGSLTTERKRDPEHRKEVVYINKYSGFATHYRDARIILDVDTAYGSNPLPSWFDVSPLELAYGTGL